MLARATTVGEAAPYPSRGQQIAAVTEADRCRVPTAYGGRISNVRPEQAANSCGLTQTAGDDLGAVLREDKGIHQRQVHGGGLGRGGQRTRLRALRMLWRRAPWRCFLSLRARALTRELRVDSRGSVLARLGSVVRRFSCSAQHCLTPHAPASHPPPPPSPSRPTAVVPASASNISPHPSALPPLRKTPALPAAATRDRPRAPEPPSPRPRALSFDRIPQRASAHQRLHIYPWHLLARIATRVSCNRGGASPGVATAAVPSPTALPAARAHR